MKKEESTQLKEGQTVYIAVKYLGTTTDGESAHVKIQTTDWMDIGFNSVVSISPNVSFEHIVIPSPVKENKPKYDPCRKFREGDRVTPKVVNGRDFNNVASALKGKVLIVTEDEEEFCDVYVKDNEDEFGIDPAYLELITPAEELEPYVVRLAIPDGVEEWHVALRNNNLALVAVFGHCHPNAKAAAEAECQRLNEEWRKEQK